MLFSMAKINKVTVDTRHQKIAISDVFSWRTTLVSSGELCSTYFPQVKFLKKGAPGNFPGKPQACTWLADRLPELPERLPLSAINGPAPCVEKMTGQSLPKPDRFARAENQVVGHSAGGMSNARQSQPPKNGTGRPFMQYERCLCRQRAGFSVIANGARPSSSRLHPKEPIRS